MCDDRRQDGNLQQRFSAVVRLGHGRRVSFGNALRVFDDAGPQDGNDERGQPCYSHNLSCGMTGVDASASSSMAVVSSLLCIPEGCGEDGTFEGTTQKNFEISNKAD